MPVDLGAALGDDTRLGSAQLRGGAASVFKTPVAGQTQLFARLLQSRHIDGEMCHAVQKTQKNGRLAVNARSQRLRRQPAEFRARIFPHQDIQLPQGQKSAVRVPRLLVQPPLIAALHVAVVERVPSKHMWIHVLHSGCWR